MLASLRLVLPQAGFQMARAYTAARAPSLGTVLDSSAKIKFMPARNPLAPKAQEIPSYGGLAVFGMASNGARECLA